MSKHHWGYIDINEMSAEDKHNYEIARAIMRDDSEYVEEENE